MKKTMMVLGVLLCATLLVNPAMACDGKDAKQANNEGATCSKSAAKAAYAKTLDETGCEKTAQTAYKNTLAENVYAKSYADTGCSKTAQKAAYDAVYTETSCSKSASAAVTHAVAKASYDETLAKTSCSKSAQAAYDSVTKTAGASCDKTKCDKAKGDKGAVESPSEVPVDANVKLASKDSK